jgi:hypothetical protein
VKKRAKGKSLVERWAEERLPSKWKLRFAECRKGQHSKCSRYKRYGEITEAYCNCPCHEFADKTPADQKRVQ